MTQRITLSSLYTETANIIAYNATTKVVTLDKPINVSLGTNSLLTGDGSSVDISSKYSINGVYTNVAKAMLAGNTATLSTDEAGNFIGIFNVPPGRFQNGQRVFRVDNRSVPTDPSSATTYAEATFTAAGLATTSQKLNFAPSVDSSGQTFTQVSQVSNQLISTITTYNPLDPIAQTIIVSKDNYPNGLFLRSVKLFFQSVPASNIPITVSIIPTINGYPGGQSLPYSTVIKQPNECNTSSSPHYLDPKTYTEFVFEAPVYIQSGVLYAILIKTTSVDYRLYFAQQNSVAVPSTAKALPTDPNPTATTKIGASPSVGALFESQNAITWTADQSKDLMFVVDKCVFRTNVQAEVPFILPRNLPYRKLGVQDLGFKLGANVVSNLYGNYAPSQFIDAINVTTTDFTPTGTSTSYKYQSLLKAGNVPTAIQPITPGAFGNPTPEHVYLNDGLGQRALVRQSSNSFSLFATLSSSDPNLSPVIADDGVTLYGMRYIINDMGIGNNVVSVANTGIGYNANTVLITVSPPDIGSNTASLGFTANANGAITSVYVINPGSGYLTTPTVTITESAGNTRAANANAIISIVGETSPKGGNSYAKYFTKKVVLAPGNDSGDLRVFYSGYVPYGSAVYVYYKILSSQDTSVFEQQDWQLMTTVTGQYTYSKSRDELIEFEAAPGIFESNLANNNISYTSTNGSTYDNFIQFAIKIVLATNDNTSVPYITGLRALALPPGTNA